MHPLYTAEMMATLARLRILCKLSPHYFSMREKRCRVCQRRRGKREGSEAFLRHLLQCLAARQLEVWRRNFPGLAGVQLP